MKSWIATSVLGALSMISCKGGRQLNTRDPYAPAQSPPALDGGWTMEEGAKLMSNPIIDVQPVAMGSTLKLLFRVRDRAPGRDIPSVSSISVSKPEEPRFKCKLKATNDQIPLAEWAYDETPAGFARMGCEALTRGGYDIYVVGLGARGTVRMKIDDGGAVTRLPWYGEEDGSEGGR